MKVIFEMDEKERWKVIKEFPDYVISNYGRVKRIKDSKTSNIGKFLKPQFDRDGYLHVNLYKNGKSKTKKIHKLVTEAFIGPCPKGYEVNHIDGNKKNPHVDNLEYITHSKNIKHAYKLDLRSQKCESNNNSKLKKEDILKIRKLYEAEKYYQKEIAKLFDVSQSHISDIVNRQVWV